MEILREYGNEIDVIEVIGHTDEQVVSTEATSNLDEKMIHFFDNKGADENNNWLNLNVADNAGLGLARAASISVLIWHYIPEFRDRIKILPYSAGQMIENQHDVIATGPIENRPSRERRRIEIRFRGKTNKRS